MNTDVPWPQRRLRDPRIAPDNVGGHDIVGDEQPTLRIELRRTLDCAATAESGLLLTLGCWATTAAERRAACGRRHAPQHPREEFGFLGVVLDRDNPRLAN